jgi:stage V sporulation protein R
MDSFINPDFLEEQQRRIEEDEMQRRHFPEQPERTSCSSCSRMGLWRTGSMISWISSGKSPTTCPQRQTKIMNEGWASRSHPADDRAGIRLNELIDYADHHSGTVAVHPVS